MTGRTTHGHTRGRKTTPEFRTWCAMIQRCTYEKSEKYPSYGAKGIKVCDRWLNSFEAFLEDMGPRPEGMTLDRIDSLGNYEPMNCRWATAEEQVANRAPFVHANSAKTHCPSGHPYDGDNLIIRKNGGRKCRECDRLRAAEYRQRQKEKKAK